MIGEQRLRARLAALDAAVRFSDMFRTPMPTIDVISAAEHFEEWLLRPDGTGGTQDGPTAGRLPCGAFTRPPWYDDDMQRERAWLECNGTHGEHGWHLTMRDGAETTFHSHHALIDGEQPWRCACGSAVWPCPVADPGDMTK